MLKKQGPPDIQGDERYYRPPRKEREHTIGGRQPTGKAWASSRGTMQQSPRRQDVYKTKKTTKNKKKKKKKKKKMIPSNGW